MSPLCWCMLTSSTALLPINSFQSILIQQHLISHSKQLPCRHFVHLTGTQTGLFHLCQQEYKSVLNLLRTGSNITENYRLTVGAQELLNNAQTTFTLVLWKKSIFNVTILKGKIRSSVWHYSICSATSDRRQLRSQKNPHYITLMILFTVVLIDG